MDRDEEIKRAAEGHRRFREQAAFSAWAMSMSILADAHVHHLDVQEALKQPYDMELLESLPQFEREGDVLIMRTRIEGTEIVCSNIGKWAMRCDLGDRIPIPAPATRAGVFKLMEVFS